MVETVVKCPLRPTLLVISAAQQRDALSLAERTGRQYAENMRRLTEKFSKRHWNIAIVDITDEDALGKNWASLENSNMTILTGYRGTENDQALLEKLTTATNPIITLVNLGANLTKADLSGFHKAVSLLTPALEEQFAFTTLVLKDTRQENNWGEYKPNERDIGDTLQKAQQKYIN